MYSKITLSLAFIFAVFNLFGQEIWHSEMIGKITDKEATVQLGFDEDVEFDILWGLDSNKLVNSLGWKKSGPKQMSNVVLNSLTTDEYYYYRVQYRIFNTTQIIQRPIRWFHTARKIGSSFVFVVQADPHMDEQSDSSIYKLCLKNQLEDKPDFMIDLGDILMSDKLRNTNKIISKDTVEYRANLMRRYYEILGHSVPVYIANGNHEGESGWYLTPNGENVAVWGTNARNTYFMNPSDNGFFSGDTTSYDFVGQRKSYYSWNWGDAQFIVLDPYWFTKLKPDSLNGWRWTLGDAQYQWLKKTLEESDAKFRFVFAHHLIGGDKDGRGGVEAAEKYEWGGDNLDGSRGFEQNRVGWDKPIKELLKDYKVTIFFHGHDHFFGKQEKECLVYQEVPQPSHPNFNTVNYAEGYGYHEGEILPNSGHLRVTVHSDTVKVEYVRVYLPKNETSIRKNKNVSATYLIGANSCYDTLGAHNSSIVIWNKNVQDQLVYPNPSHNDQRICINLKFNKDEVAKVEALDLNGRLVRTIAPYTMFRKGEYQVFWDRLDEFGTKIYSGNFVLRTTSQNGKSTTQKIILQ